MGSGVSTAQDASARAIAAAQEAAQAAARATQAAATGVVPTTSTFPRYGVGLFLFFVAIVGFSGSSYYISSTLKTSGNWAEIQTSVAGYATVMGLGALCMALGWALFMYEYYTVSHILLAIMAAGAFGMASTALAVSTISLS
jgi:hypothetical protein